MTNMAELGSYQAFPNQNCVCIMLHTTELPGSSRNMQLKFSSFSMHDITLKAFKTP